jgi:hypothetical protein
VLRVDRDRDHLPVLGADDHARATVAQPRRGEAPAEERQDPEADEDGDTDKELDGHGRPPRFGFTSRRSRRKWSI